MLMLVASGSALQAPQALPAEAHRCLPQPDSDPKGSGYQICQSLIAVGSGGIWGQGSGPGADQGDFLPIPYTDFTSSFLRGASLLGVAIVLLLYFILMVD